MNEYPPSGWDGRPGGPNNSPPTSEFGPVQQPPYGYGPPPKQGMSTPLVVAITLLVVLLVGLLVATAFFVAPRLMGDSEGAPTSTVSVTATAPAESGDQPGGDASPTVQPARPAPGGRPAGAYECWSSGSSGYNSVAVGSSVTSCEFAASVWGEYIGAGGNGGSMTVRAYSPVTGSSYTMSCSGGAVITCTGGNNAVVYIY